MRAQRIITRNSLIYLLTLALALLSNIWICHAAPQQKSSIKLTTKKSRANVTSAKQITTPTQKSSSSIKKQTSTSTVKEGPCDTIELMRKNKLEAAIQCATQLKHRHLIKATKWLYYSDPDNKASFEEIIQFIRNNPDFPDKNLLSNIAEQKINSSTNKVMLERWCLRNSPSTGKGAKACLNVLMEASTHKKIPSAYLTQIAKRAWTRGHHTQEEEKVFMDKHAEFLTKYDHINRLNYILVNEQRLSPATLDKLDDAHKKLFSVKLHLAKNRKKLPPSSNLPNTVATYLRGEPLLLYLQARWYLFHKDIDRLYTLLTKHSRVPSIKTDQWFKLRSLLVSYLMDEGNYKKAYEIAASHTYQDPSNYVDGEWLAGKIAYLHLRKPKLAYTHFKNILDKSKYSISLAKGAYWSGMAMKSIGNEKEAIKYFKIASTYIDTFYGQLALMKINHNRRSPHSLKKPPKVTKEDLQWAQNNDLLIISNVFASAHKHHSTRKFIQTALNNANTDGKKFLIAKFGSHAKIHLLATISGKEAARRGFLFIEPAYPTLKLKFVDLDIENALVHSIIRQESEFNATAKSSAGALGLMQLMYPTAKQTAQKLKLPITHESLKDRETNITVGANHIQELIDSYNGSYILAIAAYNAGGKKVNEWINKYGDPRKLKKLEKVVTWIENIPFPETRGYVQYVLSNLQIYRNLLQNPSTKHKRIYIDLGQDLVL